MLFFMLAGGAFLAGMIINSIIRKIVNELVAQTDNLETVKSTFFKQMKLRYENYIRIGHEINNTDAFAGKYLDKYKLHGITINGYEKVSAFLSGMCVVSGICGALADKDHAMEYLLIGFLAMYIVSGYRSILDVNGKRKRIKINIVDYFENRYYAVTAEPIKQEKAQTVERKPQPSGKIDFTDEEKQIIDDILREYLG